MSTASKYLYLHVGIAANGGKAQFITDYKSVENWRYIFLYTQMPKDLCWFNSFILCFYL